MKNLNAILLTAGACWASFPAHGQTQTIEPERSLSSTLSQDIVVTARRRAENLQDVPISVSAISGEALRQSGVTDAQSLQYRTPSLSITSAQSQRNTVAFSLRGQRTQETQLFTDPPVGTYFAEVVQPRPYSFGNSLYDLESVQVLKGVQGTLFGRNMTGGAILVEPAHPKLGEFAGEVRAQYGNYDMRDLMGMINIPIGDRVALRFAGKFRERDGWAKDVSGLRLDDQNYDSFRISFLVEPNDRISSLTIFDYYDSDERGTASFLTSLRLPSLVSAYEGLRAGGVIDTNIPAQFAEAQALFAREPYSLNIGVGKGGNLDFPASDYPGAPFEKIRNWGITNKTTIDLSDTLRLKNIFGYRKSRREVLQDYDGIPASLLGPHQHPYTRNISEELQLQGEAFQDRLSFIVGAFYFDEKGDDSSIGVTSAEYGLFNAGYDPRTADARLVANNTAGGGYSRTAAGFAAGTFHLTDQFNISGGLRYNYDKRHITVRPNLTYAPNASGGVGVCLFDIDAETPGLQTVPIADCHFTNKKSFKEWTYDATVQYEPSDAITLYASYRHGFRAGGFSARATSYIALQPFLPEFVNEYEVGLKTSHRVGSGTLRTSLALFRQDGSDVQKQRAHSPEVTSSRSSTIPPNNEIRGVSLKQI